MRAIILRGFSQCVVGAVGILYIDLRPVPSGISGFNNQRVGTSKLLNF